MRRPWKPGDPIGCGEVFLPTRKAVEEYTAACIAAQITADARAVCAIPDRATRAARVAMYPEYRRDALKARILELWNARK